MKQDIVRNNLFTGVIVLLPISLFIIVIVWLYRIIDAVVEPFTGFYNAPRIITNLVVVATLLVIVFLTGVAAKTRLGSWFFSNLDKNVFSYLPGYKSIKQMINPFLGEGYKKSFKSVALVDIFGNGTLMTAFITDKTDEYTTVFVPTGPNPTSGNIYHVPHQRVQLVDARVDQVLRAVIAVGAGSSKLINKLKKR